MASCFLDFAIGNPVEHAAACEAYSKSVALLGSLSSYGFKSTFSVRRQCAIDLLTRSDTMVPICYLY